MVNQTDAELVPTRPGSRIPPQERLRRRAAIERAGNGNCHRQCLGAAGQRGRSADQRIGEHGRTNGVDIQQRRRWSNHEGGGTQPGATSGGRTRGP